MNILANDGISPAGLAALETAGHRVWTDFVPAEELAEFINSEQVDGLLVRSATKVREPLIDACPNLKFIIRGGVGMDNIDVAYARSKGVQVNNTPAASSQSVAELVMGHLFTLSRFLHDSNRRMPVEGGEQFKALKKAYGKGRELRGMTLAVVGFGRIGQSLAQYAIGCGMKVIGVDQTTGTHALTVDVAGQQVSVDIPLVTLDEALAAADAMSLHIPAQADGQAVIDAEAIAKAFDLPAPDFDVAELEAAGIVVRDGPRLRVDPEFKPLARLAAAAESHADTIEELNASHAKELEVSNELFSAYGARPLHLMSIQR